MGMGVRILLHVVLISFGGIEHLITAASAETRYISKSLCDELLAYKGLLDAAAADPRSIASQAFAKVEDDSPLLPTLSVSYKGRMENLFLPMLTEAIATALKMFDMHLAETMEGLRRRSILSLDSVLPIKTISELKVQPGFVSNVYFGLLVGDYGPKFHAQWDFRAVYARTALLANPRAFDLVDPASCYRANMGRMGLSQATACII